jgi:hypothetical protein
LIGIITSPGRVLAETCRGRQEVEVVGHHLVVVGVGADVAAAAAAAPFVTFNVFPEKNIRF